ncbi:HAD-IA family hydrolase [Aquabacter spiritensis]|uniref:Phosphoglycolate phosphatase n=1 Tax=Aquabacter spiritensis TaxID=933073 RepID=A0A4R3LS02_9HYPH|nr:HAD-IA family hydrolase [Aquabacter spiritensis]TCT00947.1 phosphoglycolate phosphatase [Aquabacter spiritensis]
MSGAPLKLVLFDCDGTLVDGQHMIVAAMSAAHRVRGLAVPPRDAILSVVGLSLPETFAVLSQGDPAYPVEALVEGYKTAFHQLRDAHPMEPMYAGTRTAVAALRAEAQTLLGIVTGKSRRGVARVLEAHAMEGWFSTIQTAEDAPSKPDPAMVRQAMAEVGGVPEATVVIGDTTYDMEMAKAAGAFAIGVGWGYHPPDKLVAAGADELVEDARRLPDAVRALLARHAARRTAREVGRCAT